VVEKMTSLGLGRGIEVVIVQIEVGIVRIEVGTAQRIVQTEVGTVRIEVGTAQVEEASFFHR
jgi:hypothetical protein